MPKKKKIKKVKKVKKVKKSKLKISAKITEKKIFYQDKTKNQK